jgi:hypothetical protein
MAKLTSKGTYAVSDWSNVDALFPKTRMGTGAEDSDVTYQNDAYTQFKNLESGYWLQFLPQLGFTGPTTKEVVDSPGTENELRTTTISDEAAAAIQQFKAQGYDVVINPNKIDSGSKSVTEFAFKTPDGKFQKTWEYTGGAWYEQVAPYLGLVLPGILGMAGISAGSLGASITGQTSNALLNNAVGGAIIGGAKELITSGGDFESAIKGALTGGALGAAAELAQPYIKDAANALSNLTGEEVAQLAGTDVAATDVASNVGDVDVGGVGDVGVPAGVEQMSSGANFSPEAMQTYANEIAAGASRDLAYTRAVWVENQLQAAQSIYDRTMTPGVADAMLAGGSAPPVVNNLAGTAAPVTPPPANALVSDPYAGLAKNFPVMGDVDVGGGTSVSGYGGAGNFQAMDVAGVGATTGAANALTGGDVVSTQVTPTERIATVETNALPERPLAGTTGAGVTDAGLGAAAAGAGAVSAAGAAGAAGAGTAAGVGGQMTAADIAGLDPNLTLGGGSDVLGGTDVGGGTGAIITGAAGGAGAGALTAGGATAGLTGIPVVDDFLNYIGTPAGAAALGAFGSLAGGYLTGQAAKDAANIQAQSAQNALALQREQFEYQKGLLEPYRKAGESALGRLSGVMGLGGQPAQPQQLLDMDPGYAFRLGEGMKALERVQAARGNMLSGGAIKAGQRYAQDFASGEYGNAYNRLANIAGLGQTVGNQLGSAAQQFGQTAGETMSQGANALAAGRVGRTSGYMGGIGGAVGAYQNYQNQQQQNQLFRDIYGRMGN